MDLFVAQVQYSVWATRIYVLLFIVTFLLILLFSSLSLQSSISTVQSPTESTFERLHQLYGSRSLSCRCSQSSISYNTFLNVSADYHQVCSSAFISFNWWALVASRGDEIISLLDQPLLSNYFRMLSSFCTLSNQTVQNAINSFESNTFVSVEALTPDAFNSQVESLLNALIEQTPLIFVRSLDYITGTFRSDQLEHLFLSNWIRAFTTANETYVLASFPVSYNNDTCTCATYLSAACWWQLVFILSNQTKITLPGLLGGCLPVDGLRLSTLECLFDPHCLTSIGLLINTTTTPSIPEPLNVNLATRFPSHSTTVDEMIDQLFVEEWINASNYSAYYQACSPRTCHYTHMKHDTAVHLITSLLALYGGVTLCLRLLVVCGFQILYWIRQYSRERHHRAVMPNHASHT